MKSKAKRGVEIKKKWLKISNILYKVEYWTFSFFGFVYRNIRYKTSYFFDTNFVITKESEIDSRLKKMYLLSRRFFLTDFVKKEAEEKLQSSNFRRINNADYKTISFNSLYSQDSSICPVYYNFIGTMHNPAVLFSSEFSLQLLFAKIIKKRIFTSEENKLHTTIMTKLIKKAESNLNEGGVIKTEHERVMDEANIRSLKKRKDGLRGKNKNYPNDIRNLALVFTYAILFKENVTFITADSDATALFFDWSSALIQQIVFNMKCLEELTKDDRADMRALLQGRKKAYFFDSMELSKFIGGTLQKFYSNRKKYFAPRLSVKYWDKKRQKYFEVSINIDKYVRLNFSHLHGSLNCPSAKNDLMGSFIAYRYWPPTIYNHFVKILPQVKPIYRTSLKMPSSFHDINCLYRRQDLSDDFRGFSNFSL